MLTKILAELYTRDLDRLKTEIELFRDEADLWKTTGEITNSAGNLCLHICGNLQHVKATLGKLSSDDLARNYPLKVFDHPMTTEYFLVHLTTHLNYHLGQINYHRRLTART
ncbi:MAG: DinB family protein [Acidobacteria bacterium]|nr:DinB family protein [Acidobacteriota bacterium]